MRQIIFLLFSLCALAACANKYDPPLPEVRDSDPTWPLVQDHLEYGSLPR